jgi:CRP/FNR family transcriptional regulator, cyclic AMP receptor protein
MAATWPRVPHESIASYREVLRGSAVFARLNDGDIDSILSHARIGTFRAGQQIVSKGDPGDSVMAVLRGRVSISVPSLDGRRVVLSMLRDGAVFGEIAFLDGKERTADARALTRCEILIVPRHSLWSLLELRTDLCIDLMLILCDRLRHTNNQVEDLSFLGLESRMAKVLLRLLSESEGNHDHEYFTVRISQRILGELAGGSRESINKHLNSWKELGIITIDKGVIFIRDIATLTAYAE